MVANTSSIVVELVVEFGLAMARYRQSAISRGCRIIYEDGDSIAVVEPVNLRSLDAPTPI